MRMNLFRFFAPLFLKCRNLCFALLSVLSAAPLLAQTTYFCDFEDEQERAAWTLNLPRNTANTFPNLWYIGRPGGLDGENGLYLSSDGGQTMGYTATQNIMIAWREVQLDAGDYELSFNWLAQGSATDFLMAAWIPENQYADMLCSLNTIWQQQGTSQGRPWIWQNLVKMDGLPATQPWQLYNSPSWTYAIGQLHTDGKPHRLCFIWINSGPTVVPPAVAVDNIQIAANLCGAPTDLTAETQGQQVTLRWKSEAESFNIRYRRHGDHTATTLTGIKQPEILLTLPYGAYDVFVQNICHGQPSVWYGFPIVLIHNTTCFDFLQLNDSNCYYKSSSTAGVNTIFEPEDRRRVDFGYANEASAHTIHYVEGEIDQLTLNSTDANGNSVPPLKTVPDGEIASVRLGWKKATGSVSRIVYDYMVDTREAAVLMLKYACVLEMAGHSHEQQPRFTLDIKDADTGEILEQCTSVDFSPKANSATEGWNYNGPVTSATTWSWKDWTTVALNLDKHNGKHVQVELTSSGCTPTGHGGYAYFTVECTSGRIEGINCGDTPTSEFIAPEGFNYTWYLARDASRTPLKVDGGGNPLTPASRVFHVDYRDTVTYKVDLHYITDPACYFTLTASAMPRYPVPEASWQITTAGCRHHIAFSNTSHIRLKDIRADRFIDTATPPEGLVWDFGTLLPPSAEWEPAFDLPAEGGDFSFSLMASVGLCDSVQLISFSLPAIGDTTVCDTAYECSGNAYSFEGRTYTRDTLITTTGLTWAGCDSTHQQRVVFRPSYHLTLDSTIYEGGVVHIGPESFTETGRYTVRMQTAAGCDSVMNLSLVMVPRLRTELVDTEYPCLDQPDFTASFRMLTGRATDGAFVWSRLQEGGPVSLPADTFRTKLESGGVLRVPLPAGLQPGWYDVTAVLSSPENGPDTLRFELMVRYPSSLIQQRWNNVLGLSRAGYGVNPDWEFTSWQWYKNGQPVEEATGGYYYEEPSLDTQSRYAVELTRPGCERSVMTCDLTPRPVSESDVHISPDASGDTRPSSGPARKLLQDGRLLIELFGRRYTLLGQPL